MRSDELVHIVDGIEQLDFGHILNSITGHGPEDYSEELKVEQEEKTSEQEVNRRGHRKDRGASATFRGVTKVSTAALGVAAANSRAVNRRGRVPDSADARIRKPGRDDTARDARC